MNTDKNSQITQSGTPAQPEQTVSDNNQGKARLKYERISYEEWLVKYRPIKNPFDANAADDGCMFETYGPDFEFVRQQPVGIVWTLVEDGEKLFVCEGFHYINRLGYYVTEIPAPANSIFVIRAD
jgi:hypothetical protein